MLDRKVQGLAAEEIHTRDENDRVDRGANSLVEGELDRGVAKVELLRRWLLLF